MNTCGWIAPMVTLVDGRTVPSDAEEWRAECEARHHLATPHDARKEALEKIGQRRGSDALASLLATMDDVEPAYVLTLPNKAQRNGYVDKVAHHRGENSADHLRNRVRALHEQRKAVADSTSGGA